MTGAMIFKAVILLLIVIILISLASGLVFLVKDKSESDRTAKSLTIRVALSVLLFVLLFVGFATGLIKPHGLAPEQTEKALR